MGSKLDRYIWWANHEAYRTGVRTQKKDSSDLGFVRKPSKEELDRYFIDAGLLGGYDPTGHWCGIFQTYLMTKAGIECYWLIGVGIQIKAASKSEIQIDKPPAAREDLRMGDIVVVEYHGHHLMVLEPTRSGAIPCIEGNAKGLKDPCIGAYYTGNNLHNVVGEISIRYRILS